MNFQWKDIQILIVEDDKDMLQILCEFFREEEAQVFPATNGKIALDIMENQKIDFVISDVQMPVMTGDELLKEIRKRNPQIPIVLLATGQSQLTEESALALGAAGLVHKPFKGRALVNQVRDLLIKTSG